MTDSFQGAEHECAGYGLVYFECAVRLDFNPKWRHVCCGFTSGQNRANAASGGSGALTRGCALSGQPLSVYDGGQRFLGNSQGHWMVKEADGVLCSECDSGACRLACLL
jgi:hypothetical protein